MLNENEKLWIQQFSDLSHQSQCLLVRLLSRKGEWFRSDKLVYTEIPDLTLALTELDNGGFITLSPPITQKAIARCLFTKAEIVTLFNLPSSPKKEELIESLPDENFAAGGSLPFIWLKLNHATIIDYLLVLFFANTRQDLSQFVLEELGLHRFEQYRMCPETRFFTSREQVEALCRIQQLREAYSECNRKEAEILLSLLAQLPPDTHHEYTEHRRQRLINDLSRDLERGQHYHEALHWFSQTQIAPSRERRARIYDKLQRWDEMEACIRQMRLVPQDQNEQEVARKLEQRLCRARGEKVQRQLSKPAINTHHVRLDLSKQRVELAVKAHLEHGDCQVFYLENHFLNGLFGLVFWETIFAPVKGAFINAYQHQPLDLYYHDFEEKRLPLVEQAFAQLTTEGIHFYLNRYRQKLGIANPFIHWGIYTPDILVQTFRHVPRATLKALMTVFLSDIRTYRNGMPDLIAFSNGSYEWIEVKGPGDKLQENQLRWMEVMNRLNIPFSVYYVNQ